METTRLTEVTGRLLAEARTAPGGRSAHTLHGGPGGHLRQTVLALAAGHGLAEHDNPGEATLQVLAGEVTLRSATESWTGTAGDHVTITRERHELLAARDSAVLLTILPTGPGEFPPAG
ncbi:cupin domain-containing protein [Actinoplanes sp. G11-F43]|uniref:cupin domain-containing protein n=1 Tax=Actinoplanes sp. G11-F43 TaxID=3424130 RepID=UPI003D33C4AD